MSGVEEAVMRNIQAVGELTEIVRTSFGPNGEWIASGTVFDTFLSNALYARQVATSSSSTTLENSL